MTKGIKFLAALVVVLGLAVSQAAALDAPAITLDRVEIAGYQKFFMKPRIGFKDANDPGKEENVGAIMNLAFIFMIKNPNKDAVMLDEVSFNTAFDGYEVGAGYAYEDAWIPGGKTNELKVLCTYETVAMAGALAVPAPNVARMQEQNAKPGELLKKWWETIEDASFPVGVTNGMALFKDEKGKDIRVTFTGTFGGATPAEEKKEVKKEEKKEEKVEKKEEKKHK